MFLFLFLSYLTNPVPSDDGSATCCTNEPPQYALCMSLFSTSVSNPPKNTTATSEGLVASADLSSDRELGTESGYPQFRIGVNEVLVSVAVSDAEGRLVGGLKPNEFRIFEDGVEQQVDFVLDEAAPFTVGIVVDTSGSMKEKMDGTRMALSRFLEHLEPRDQAFMLAFNDFLLPVQDLTQDHDLLLAALYRLEPDGGTALYDAVVEGLYRLHQTRTRKRALVLLSDGMDSSSINTVRDAIGAANATGIPVYTIGLGKRRGNLLSRLLFSDPMESDLDKIDEITLRDLSAKTGGRALFVADMERKGSEGVDTLGLAFERVARELRNFYLLGYRPARVEMDGRWHILEVKIARENLYTRFRPGYLAAHLQ